MSSHFAPGESPTLAGRRPRRVLYLLLLLCTGLPTAGGQPPIPPGGHRAEPLVPSNLVPEAAAAPALPAPPQLEGSDPMAPPLPPPPLEAMPPPHYPAEGLPAPMLDPQHAGPFAMSPPMDFQHGEYVARDRLQHVPLYRLRVDDQLEFVYRVTRNETTQPYRINVGDELRVEAFDEPRLNHERLVVQPDGTITLRLLGQIRATRRTVPQLRTELEQLYSRYYKNLQGQDAPPADFITVTPLKVNTKLEDLRSTVDNRFGQGGQSRLARVTPEGTIQLPAVGSIFVQGLTLDELKREVDQRYAAEVDGIEVIPVLVARAPRFVYVIGEVRVPGRYAMESPTSAMQAISLAGGWNVGANLHQVVVFRRDDQWRLMATMVDLWDPLYGNTPHAADIWLGDSDVVVVPKMKILVLDEFIELIFGRGVYGIVPFNGVSVNMSKLSTL